MPKRPLSASTIARSPNDGLYSTYSDMQLSAHLRSVPSTRNSLHHCPYRPKSDTLPSESEREKQAAVWPWTSLCARHRAVANGLALTSQSPSVRKAFSSPAFDIYALKHLFSLRYPSCLVGSAPYRTACYCPHKNGDRHTRALPCTKAS